MEVRRDPPPVKLKPVYHDGELLFHPDIPDMDAWREEQRLKRWIRRRQMWGRLCWGWFFVVLSYLCFSDTSRWPKEKSAELDAYVRKMMMIASVPVAVRGFWHRIQSGE